jgi:plasmid stabilization system protein ParE
MDLDVLFEPEAKAEFIEAIAWHENESAGLGKQFAQEVLDSVERAQAQPELYRKTHRHARKIHLKRFKAYSLYFATKGDVFSVLSVFHGARNPDDLKNRLR